MKISGLLVEGYAEDFTIKLNNLTFIEDIDNYENEFIKKNRRNKYQYQGPSLNTLNQDLQLQIYDFLSKLGLNFDIINILDILSTEKETLLKAKWYEKLNEIKY